MKRVPLKQLKNILRVGDYLGLHLGHFGKIYTVETDYFEYGNRFDPVRIHFDKTKNTYNSFYWLPSELLESTEIAGIARERRKEQK